LENPPKGGALWKPKAVTDADAFIQKWDFKGPGF
jgi:hypothetical protein